MAKYIAGYNQPGYLPETDPVEFDDFDDAQSSIIDELDNAAEIAYNSDDDLAGQDCDESKEEAEQWNEGTETYWQAYCDGYVYWIVKEE